MFSKNSTQMVAPQPVYTHVPPPGGGPARRDELASNAGPAAGRIDDQGSQQAKPGLWRKLLKTHHSDRCASTHREQKIAHVLDDRQPGCA
jgi:hypothetical protein